MRQCNNYNSWSTPLFLPLTMISTTARSTSRWSTLHVVINNYNDRDPHATDARIVLPWCSSTLLDRYLDRKAHRARAQNLDKLLFSTHNFHLQLLKTTLHYLISPSSWCNSPGAPLHQLDLVQTPQPPPCIESPSNLQPARRNAASCKFIPAQCNIRT